MTTNAAFATFLAGVLRPFDAQLQAMKRQVEDGASIADAIRSRPRIVRIECEYDAVGRLVRAVPIYEDQ